MRVAGHGEHGQLDGLRYPRPCCHRSGPLRRPRDRAAMRPRRTPFSALLAALALAVFGGLLGTAASARAMVVLPDSARGACPSCQVDDPEAPVSATTIVISGRGYGHGLGMSQWGAYGLAQAGAGFQRILRFYYPGTQLGGAPVAAVRVKLADAVATVTISSAAPFVATDASGRRWELPAGDVVLDSTLSLPVGVGGVAQPVPGPVVFKPRSLPLALGGTLYRGSLQVSLVAQLPPVTRTAAIAAPAPADPLAPAAPGKLAPVLAPGTVAPAVVSPGLPGTGAPTAAPTPAPATAPATAPSPPPVATPLPAGGLSIVNTVGLEAYLAGVVAREVPASWPAAALQAQAVAARSYALAHRAAGLDFDLFADERSQVYGGIAAEQPSTTAAVKATAGQVVLWRGAVADTLFSASNGGRTVSAAEAYPGNPEPPPYLVARDDPYDAAASPYAQWGPVVVPAEQVEAALGLPGALVDMTLVDPDAVRPTSVTLTTASGMVTVPTTRLRSALGLRSSWLEIGVISLSRSALPVSYGAKVTLGGVVRGLSGMLLERRTTAGWQSIDTATPDQDGRFEIVTTALSSSDFRLTGGNIVGSPVSGAQLSLPVSPRVKLLRAADGSGLSGTLRPALGGTLIEIQFDGSGTGTSWSSLGTATVGADGRFLASLPLATGSYRAVVPAASGVAATSTAPVKVTIVS